MAAPASQTFGSSDYERSFGAKAPPRAPLARIGKYEVEAEIGHSSPVKVFRAFDRDIGRPVTLKVLTEVTDKKLIERFRQETATAAKLHHPNVIAIYELGEHVGLPFAAMQNLGDESLARAIRMQRQLTLLQKMLVMEHVAEGLQAAHQGGLGYVGVRPSGIALGADGTVIIQDFGIVRAAGEEEEGGYTAPEALAPGFSPDTICDIFCFGAVYYELLTGLSPFAGSPRGQPANSHSEPPRVRELAPDCPVALERMVHRALEPQRELRYQALDELRYDIEPALRELKRTRAALLLGEVRRLMDARAVDAALEGAREVLELDPDNRKAQKLHMVLRELRQRRTVQARVAALLRRADEEAAYRRFEQAAETLDSALRLDPADAGVKARLEEIQARLEERDRAVQLVAEARVLLEQQNLEEARARVSEALEKDPHSPQAGEVMQQVTEAIERRERDAKIGRELAKAKSLLVQQSFDEALTVLLVLRSECPGSPLVDHWVAHARTQKAEADRQSRFHTQMGEARTLIAQQRFNVAVAKLEELVRDFAEEEEPPRLLAEARKAMERSWKIAQATGKCKELWQAGKFEKALEVVDGALAAYPGDETLFSLRQEVGHDWQRSKSAEAGRQALKEVEWLLEQGRPDLAARLLREKSALGVPEVAAKLAELEEILPGWEERRFTQEVLGRAGALEQKQQWRVAMTVLEEALESYPASPQLRQASERLQERLREQEQHDRRQRLARRVETIQQKMASQAWSAALSLVEAAQVEFPGEPELKARAEQARGGIRRAECESIVSEVRQCLADGETEQAEEILRRALQNYAAEPVLEALRKELEDDKKYQEEWRTAQVFLGRRQFQHAERLLVDLAARKPDRADVRALLETVRGARAEREEENFYDQGRQKALALIEEKQFEQAGDLLRNLLSLFPNDPILERDLQLAQAGMPPAAEAGQAAAAGKVDAEKPREQPEKEPVKNAAPASQDNSTAKAATTGQPSEAPVPVPAVAAKPAVDPPKPATAPPKPAAAQRPPAKPPERVATAKPPAAAAKLGPAAPKAAAEKKAPASADAKPSSAPAGLTPPFSAFAPPEPSRFPRTTWIPIAAVLLVAVLAAIWMLSSKSPSAAVPGRSLPPADLPAANSAAPGGSSALSAALSKPESDKTQRGRSGPTGEGRAGAATGGPSQAPPLKLNRDPELISDPAVEIPAVAQRLGLSGEVNVEATIDTNGAVKDVTVVDGNAVLASAVKDAVRKRRYWPALLNGKPVEKRVPIRAVFERAQ